MEFLAVNGQGINIYAEEASACELRKEKLNLESRAWWCSL